MSIVCRLFAGVSLDGRELLLREGQHRFSAVGRRRVSRSALWQQIKLIPTPVPQLFVSSPAGVSWVCGWTPSCTEAPPPNAPPSTTSPFPPSRTSTSTAWKSGPSSSRTHPPLLLLHLLSAPNLQTPSSPPSQVYYASLGGEHIATPQWHLMFCERRREAAFAVVTENRTGSSSVARFWGWSAGRLASFKSGSSSVFKGGFRRVALSSLAALDIGQHLQLSLPYRQTEKKEGCWFNSWKELILSVCKKCPFIL